MELTEKELEAFKNDPLMKFLASLFGFTPDELVKEHEEKETSCSKNCNGICKDDLNESDEEISKKINKFFDRIVENGKATSTIEDGQPHYNIKTDETYSEPESPDTLVEENGLSFSMTAEELEDFIRDYTKLENTVRKLEHAYGIDLNANSDSIYSQYNNIIWNLIEKIFGEDNRDDIADFCFGDSNFDTVKDLYEELV